MHVTQESLLRGCRKKSVCVVWNRAWIEEVQENRARAWLRTAPLRRTEEKRCKTELRDTEILGLFLRAADVPLLIIIRESDNGYRLLPRCDHGVLRLPAVAVMQWVGFEVRWVLGRVGWTNPIVTRISVPISKAIIRLITSSEWSVGQMSGLRWSSRGDQCFAVLQNLLTLPSVSLFVIIVLIDYCAV